ncbi:hypothetical protein ACWGQ5_40635 [Streptomyces sp. NPDC055722]
MTFAPSLPLASLLTQVAAAVIAALVVRPLVQLWNARTRSGRPMAAAPGAAFLVDG